MNQKRKRRKKVKYTTPKRIVISSAVKKKVKTKPREIQKLMPYTEEGVPIMQEQTYGGRQQMSPSVIWQKYPSTEGK